MKVIFPPRPQGKMNPVDLPYFEKTGKWLAQRKFNETRSLLHIESGHVLSCCSRHGELHKRFILTTSLCKEIISNLKLDINLEYWIDGGVMNKTKNAGGQLIFFDILQAGRYFFGRPTQVERLKLLSEICGNPKNLVDNKLALQISDNLWLAESFTENFEDRFKESLDTDLVEGLVLRRKDSSLDNFGKNEYEVDWQIRCRKPNKMYNL